LLDDPSDTGAIRAACELCRSGAAKAVIVAFDPLQLQDSLEDNSYSEIIGQYTVKEYILKSCYRQKEEVGASALRVAEAVAQSSPFLDESKKRRYATDRHRLTALANEVVFRNPSGRATTYDPGTGADWNAHFSWLRRQAGLWRDWSPLLLVLDPDVTLTPSAEAELSTVKHDRIDLRHALTVKGLEYQHVVMWLSAQRYDALQKGFSGSGQRLYNEYRLLRIPFSRARDSVAVFVHRV
jgi:hypothetical protein